MAIPTLKQLQDTKNWLECIANGADYRKCALPDYDAEQVVLSLLGFYDGQILAYGARHSPAVSAALIAARANWTNQLHGGVLYAAPSTSYFLALNRDLQNALAAESMQFNGYNRSYSAYPTPTYNSLGAPTGLIQAGHDYLAARIPSMSALKDLDPNKLRFVYAAHRNGGWYIQYQNTNPVSDSTSGYWGSVVFMDSNPSVVRSWVLSTDPTQASNARKPLDNDDAEVWAGNPPPVHGAASGSPAIATPYSPAASSPLNTPSSSTSAGSNGGAPSSSSSMPPSSEATPPPAGGTTPPAASKSNTGLIAAALAAAAYALSR